MISKSYFKKAMKVARRRRLHPKRKWRKKLRMRICAFVHAAASRAVSAANAMDRKYHAAAVCAPCAAS